MQIAYIFMVQKTSLMCIETESTGSGAPNFSVYHDLHIARSSVRTLAFTIKNARAAGPLDDSIENEISEAVIEIESQLLTIKNILYASSGI